MNKKEEIIKDSMWVMSARYISQVIGFFTAFLLRKFLGPFYMGIWSLLRLGIDYGSFLLLGVDQGMLFKIPFYSGQNDKDQEEIVKNSAFSFMFIVSLLTAFILIVLAVVLRHKYPPQVTSGLCIVSLYMILDRICGYYQLLLRAKQRFSVLSKVLIFDSIINLVLIILLVKQFKLYGLYVTIMCVAIFNTIFMHSIARYKVNFALDLGKIKKMMKIGLPITGMAILQWGLSSVDRIMIAKMIGITFVGYYSITVMARTYINQLSGLGTVLYPKVVEAYAREGNIADIKKYTIIPVAINAYLVPLILGGVFFIGPLLIKMFLPKFIPGILPMQILLFDMFFRSCSPFAVYFFVALKKQNRLLVIFLTALLFNIVINYWAIKQGWGMNGVAVTTSFISLLVFLAVQYYAMRHFSNSREIFTFFVKVFIPIAYMALTLCFIQTYVHIVNPYLDTIIKSFLMLLIYLPFIIKINKDTQIINMLVNLLKKIRLKNAKRV